MKSGAPHWNPLPWKNAGSLIRQNSVNQGFGWSPTLTGEAPDRKIAAHSQPGEKALLGWAEGDRCARTGGWILMTSLGCSGIALAEEPLRPIALGRLLVFPSAVAAFTRDDNVFRTNQEEPIQGVIGSSSTGIRPTLRFELPLQKSSIKLAYSAQYLKYSAPELENTDPLSQYLDLDSRFQLTSTLRLQAQGHWVRGVTGLREVDPGGELRFGTRPFRVENSGAALSLDLGAMQAIVLGGRLEKTRFDSGRDRQPLFNLDREELYSRYVVRTGPADQYYFNLSVQNASQNRQSLDIQASDFQRRSAGLGIQREVSKGLGTEMLVSYATTRFDDAHARPFRGVMLEGGIASRLSDRTELQLNLRRAPLQSFFNVNAYYLNQEARFAFRHEISGRIHLGLEGVYQANAYPQAVRVRVNGPEEAQFDTAPQDGILDAFVSLLPSEGRRRRDRSRGEGLTLGYDLMRAMRLEVGYHRERRQSNITTLKCVDGVTPLESCPTSNRREYDIYDASSHQVTASLAFGWQ